MFGLLHGGLEPAGGFQEGVVGCLPGGDAGVFDPGFGFQYGGLSLDGPDGGLELDGGFDGVGMEDGVFGLLHGGLEPAGGFQEGVVGCLPGGEGVFGPGCGFQYGGLETDGDVLEAGVFGLLHGGLEPAGGFQEGVVGCHAGGEGVFGPGCGFQYGGLETDGDGLEAGVFGLLHGGLEPAGGFQEGVVGCLPGGEGVFDPGCGFQYGGLETDGDGLEAGVFGLLHGSLEPAGGFQEGVVGCLPGGEGVFDPGCGFQYGGLETDGDVLEAGVFGLLHGGLEPAGGFQEGVVGCLPGGDAGVFGPGLGFQYGGLSLDGPDGGLELDGGFDGGGFEAGVFGLLHGGLEPAGGFKDGGLWNWPGGSFPGGGTVPGWNSAVSSTVDCRIGRVSMVNGTDRSLPGYGGRLLSVLTALLTSS